MAKRIICKNEDGVQVEFNYSFEPFFLVSSGRHLHGVEQRCHVGKYHGGRFHVSGKHHQNKETL